MSAAPARSSFSRYFILAIFVALGGLVADLRFPGAALFVNVICLFALCGMAVNCARKGYENFDHIVAAESLIAFGVFSLVMGLVAALFRFQMGLYDAEALRRGELTILIPFAEGLATAALGPIFGLMLRMSVMEAGNAIDATGDIADLAKVTAELTVRMTAAKTAVENFGNGAIKGSWTTNKLAETMKTEADKWGLALVEGQAHVKTFGEAAKVGSADVSKLAAEMQSLKQAVSEDTKLLQELSQLIAAVERFVGPGAGRKAS